MANASEAARDLDPAARPADAGREPLRQRLDRLLARTVRTRTARATHATPVVSFTFDDVPESGATTGAAILEAAGVRGTYYIAGDLLGRQEPERRLATLDQCLDLHGQGHEVASHTFAHRHVGSYCDKALADDLARNEAVLTRAHPGLTLKNFAYPYNATSLPAKWRLERRFRSCRGGTPGINAGSIDLGFLRAVELCDAMIDQAAVERWIGEALRQDGWLIFFTHGVTNRPEPGRCMPGLLERAVKAALESRCAVLPVQAALDRLGIGVEAAPA